ncbi:hypothetical protein B0H12DRAFT_1147983 [Mycena haematopus]|nr:hypothetical protein B0H12DRAFT_1147983 [Mycena haematopus]
MSCGVYALVHSWLVRIGASFLVVDGHLRSSIQWTIHTVASTASLLLSFESFVIVSFFTFLFLGGTLSLLVLWPLITERDRYDDCESGVYYTASRDGQWMSVAVPVILVERNGQMNGIFVPTSPRPDSGRRDRPHRGQRH